jgi:hypothetical protein
MHVADNAFFGTKIQVSFWSVVVRNANLRKDSALTGALAIAYFTYLHVRGEKETWHARMYANVSF